MFSVNVSRKRNVQVATLAEAGRVVGEFTLGKRASAWTGTGEVRNAAGVVVAVVSFNGRVWLPEYNADRGYHVPATTPAVL